MSWKTDLMILGGLGVAGYLVISNIKGITEWISGQIGGAVGSAGGAIVGGITQPVYEAGIAAGQATREYIIQPIYQAGYAAGEATQKLIAGSYETGYQVGQLQQQVQAGIGQIKSNVYTAYPPVQTAITGGTGVLLAGGIPGLQGLGLLAGLAQIFTPAYPGSVPAGFQTTSLNTPISTTYAGGKPSYSPQAQPVKILKAGDPGFAAAAYRS